MKFINCLASQEDGETVAEVFAQVLHVHLIVKQLALLLRALLIRELSSANSISNGDHSRTE